jgi:hypothetical protein
MFRNFMEMVMHFFSILQIKIPSRSTKKRQSANARRSLFSGKRLADDNLEVESPATKKSKEGDVYLVSCVN